MACENVIKGYVRKAFEDGEIVPTDARFLTVQWANIPRFDGTTFYIRTNLWWYDVPVYKKSNVKRK